MRAGYNFIIILQNACWLFITRHIKLVRYCLIFPTQVQHWYIRAPVLELSSPVTSPASNIEHPFTPNINHQWLYYFHVRSKLKKQMMWNSFSWLLCLNNKSLNLPGTRLLLGSSGLWTTSNVFHRFADLLPKQMALRQVVGWNVHLPRCANG